jgi:hypothetical protein
METTRPALRKEDMDSIEELLSIVNGLRRDNDELRHIVIKNQYAQAAIFAKALKGLKQLLCLVALAGSAWVAFDLLPDETKEELSTKYLHALVTGCVITGGVHKLIGEKDEVDEIKSGYSGYSELDQNRPVETERRRETY